ncbi:MAG: WecB/TagA/CpsF family glycosyltransferase [Peptococcaceae bacterium]|jgi:N-acetylglucosaminyldiphosphoundecaprenol N-acetyl-beta-D-mannosaminyltransferase|nr:WecB/TagA/CpsF family glycosyltransferase [Peptococcaceae bacterium]
METRTVNILGAPVAKLTMEETLGFLEAMLEKGKPGQIVTANAEILYKASRNPAYLSILRNAALVTADGSGALWASKYLGDPIAERVTGVDLFQALLPLAAEKKWSVYFLGAEQAVLDLMIHKIRGQYPELPIAGQRNGYFSRDEQQALAGEIHDSRARILFAAMGFPRQEEFIARYLEPMGVCVAIGVGGSFDVLAGKAPRAPDWFARHGLEWLYRLFKEPRRLKRTTALPKFIFAVRRQLKNKGI